jgi:hypothetical protein
MFKCYSLQFTVKGTLFQGASFQLLDNSDGILHWHSQILCSITIHKIHFDLFSDQFAYVTNRTLRHIFESFNRH